MDVIERLTLEAAQADTMLACEHRQRYELAAGFCADARVLDLCCGSGYGSAILATPAREVVGVDNDAATIETAQATVGRELPNVSFELADAVGFLGGELGGRFDVVVCFEGLEHLHGLAHALELLREHAERGLRIVASVPNGKLFGEHNPYHVTEFGYEEATRAFARFPSTVMLPQYLAEGSLLCPPGAEESEVRVTLEGRGEPEYANHFVFCVNFDPTELQRAHRGSIQLNTSPLFNRWAEDLKHGAWALHRENARLGRSRLGKGGSAAASALARVAEGEAQVEGLRQRCRNAEAKVSELEATLAELHAPTPTHRLPRPETVHSERPRASAEVLTPPAAEPAGDPNSWEQRRRRAADVLIPWIEQTVPLAGKTVLEYGCGDGAVSCAFAERAKRLIGVDIDPGRIERAEAQVRGRGLQNVELEHHPAQTILEAVAARRGEVDVFLLYAVLEHLTVSERLAVLRLAREVVEPDGAIVVCETPNRLTYLDHHTAQMPFFHLLPDELALHCYQRSERPDFKAAVDAAAQDGREPALEEIARWGRGVSFHEFEVVFGDLSRHVIASNYDPILFAERPVHPEEVVLARYLDRVRPDLAPVFSRSWLDLILSPRPLAKRPAFLRPWSAETLQSAHVGWTQWENLYLRGPAATLWVTLPHPSARLVVGSVTQAAHPLELRARAERMLVPVSASVTAAPGRTAFAAFTFEPPAQRVGLSAVSPCHIVFVGFED